LDSLLSTAVRPFSRISNCSIRKQFPHSVVTTFSFVSNSKPTLSEDCIIFSSRCFLHISLLRITHYLFSLMIAYPLSLRTVEPLSRMLSYSLPMIVITHPPKIADPHYPQGKTLFLHSPLFP
jgi:hypothetical protein